jgi:hypothetical protein
VSGLKTMADLNHDGLLDVIQIETTGLWGVTPATVTSYLGQPGGSFSAPVYSATPFADWFNIYFGNNVTLNVQGPYTGDFNGDGNLDVALFQELDTQPATVQFLAGNGDGTFTPAYNTYDLGIQHILDVVMPNAFGDGRTAWVQSPNYPASFHLMPGIVAPAFQLSMFETPAIAGADDLEISLNVPSSSATTVTLSASDPGVQLPPSATIPAGSLTVQVPFTLSNSTLGNHWFSITAAGNGTSASAYNYAVATGEADPFSLTVSGGLVGSSSAAPGQAAPWNAYVTANGEASSTFQVSCSNLPPGLSCGDFSPSSFTVPADGVASTAFSESTATSVAPGIYPFTIAATDGFITLNAAAALEVGDFNLALSPPLVVSSTGTATFSLSVGQLYGYYANISLSCSNLPAGASCQPQTQAFAGGFSVPLVVNFSNAVAPGTYTFTLTATSNSIVHTTTAQFQVVTAPAVAFSMAQVAFSPLLVGATASQSIQLTNSGNTALSITNVAATSSGVGGNFSASSNCGTTVAVQASCTITVTFSATAAGPATGTLQVTDNASGSPQTVPLSASAADFSIVPANGSSTSATISAGQSATFSLQVVPNQIQGAIGLSCTGQTVLISCFLAPSDVAVLSSSPVPFQVTVSTTAASAGFPLARNLRAFLNPRLLTLFAAALFVGFGCLFAIGAWERRKPTREAILLVVLCFSVIALVSCGGGGSGASNPGPTNPGTPSGTYILTVSGSDDGGSRSIQVTVTVQ